MFEPYEEPLCDCGSCKWCNVNASSDHDFETDEYDCSRCNGAGCTKCEE